MYTYINNGLYFVNGKGFVAIDINAASRLSYDEVTALRAVGFSGVPAPEVEGGSWMNFIR